MSKVQKAAIVLTIAYFFAASISSKKEQALHPTKDPSAFQKALIESKEKSSEPRIGQRGGYRILYNYVTMSEKVKYSENVTFATQGDFTHLGNVVPILERWKAPISVAIFAPGTDMQPTVNSITYLRRCFGPLVSQLVTFHVYYDEKHVPPNIPGRNEMISATTDCQVAPPWERIRRADTYKNRNHLHYPINVGRNIAKEAALTHYILVADIEMYPSENLPSEFLNMIKRNDQPELSTPNPKVFVLPPFEVVEDVVAPFNKTDLLLLSAQSKAFPFGQSICWYCYAVPDATNWMRTPQSNTLRVSYTTKRTGSYRYWEPVYIGTDKDPMYDEALTWEGKSDKRIQGWLLCALNYDFLILNNAFVVHRPGIKRYTTDPQLSPLVVQANRFITTVILRDYEATYGSQPDCAV